MKHGSRWIAVGLVACHLLGCAGGAKYASPQSPARYGARSYESGGDAGMPGVASVAGVGSDESYDGDADYASEPAPEAPPPPMPMPVNAKKSSAGDTTTTPTTTTSPKAPKRAPDARSPILIYTADFALAVYETVKTIDAVQSLAEHAGGYLSARSDTSITVRIPAEKFQDAIGEIQALGEVVRRNVTSEDVTAEYRDLEVQLANAIAMRDRFAALLLRATNVAESLEIERELGRVTSTIERIRGRLKVLADMAAYSTVTVNVQRKQSAVMQEGPFNLPLPWLENVGLPRLMRL